MKSIATAIVFALSVVFGAAAFLSLGDLCTQVDLWPNRPPLPGSKDILNKVLLVCKKDC